MPITAADPGPRNAIKDLITVLWRNTLDGRFIQCRPGDGQRESYIGGARRRDDDGFQRAAFIWLLSVNWLLQGKVAHEGDDLTRGHSVCAEVAHCEIVEHWRDPYRRGGRHRP